MHDTKPEIFYSVILISIFFVLLVAIIIVTALLYHSRRRLHQIEVANFQTILTQTQLEVQEQTLQTIGTELHDNVGQLLSLTSLTLNSIELADNPKVQKKINESIELTLHAIGEMRQLGHLLQGDRLVAVGLVEAIRQLVSWMERTGKYEVIYTAGEDVPPGENADKHLIIFRITQEIFNNIIKHAAASRISISLEYAGGVLNLRVADNGVGFPPAGDMALSRQGMGLQNIHKRAGIIGGEVSINSNPAQGTRITVCVPYP
jgi:two-component system NarL family sensor kinase